MRLSKRIAAGVLSAMLAVSMLVGCGNTANNGTASSGNNSSAGNNTSAGTSTEMETILTAATQVQVANRKTY